MESFNLTSLPYFIPEIALTATIFLVVLWDLVARRGKVVGAAILTLAGLGVSGAMGFMDLGRAPRALFGGLIAFDPFTNYFRLFFAVTTAVIVLFSIPAPEAGGGSARGRGAGEFYSLLLAIVVGMNLMAASRSLLMIYASLELVSVISFVMAGFKTNDRRSGEAALKYVIFGGVSSGVMLYGMSWLYGVCGSLLLPDIARHIATAGVGQAVFVGVVFTLAGFGYKIAAVPFHMWAPDVYEGAPTPVTAFLSVGPKAAGFAAMIRFFHDGLNAAAPAAVAPGVLPWTWVIGVVSVLTMTVGNFAALNQENMKRLLAYSSIAHAGYILMGFSVFDPSMDGFRAMLIYIAFYLFMNLGAFLVVQAVADRTGQESLAAYRGLSSRAPWLAVAMAIFLFSLTGIPLTAGFIGKFYLFRALIFRGGWFIVLALAGVLNSVVSFVYYARVLKAMFLTPAPEGRDKIAIHPLYGGTLLALAAPTIALGLFWSPVVELVDRGLKFLR